MEFQRREAPFVTPPTDVASIMQQVLIALAPATLAYVWYFGVGLLFNIAIAAIFCLLGEALMMRVRGRPIEVAIGDYTALITAILLAFALPPLARC